MLFSFEKGIKVTQVSQVYKNRVEMDPFKSYDVFAQNFAC